MFDTLDTLDPGQKAAVTADASACLVLAGPGSGKTTVIVHRVFHLLRRQGVLPGGILVITYTRAAAAEMRHRFEQLPGSGKDSVRFLTFHAFCYHLLRSEGRTFHLLGDAEKTRMYRRAAESLPPGERPARELFFAELSRKKSRGSADGAYVPVWLSAEVFAVLEERWKEEQKASGGLDYDDLLLWTRDYFDVYPDRLRVWQNQLSHLLIDEAQDMNPIQFSLAARLTAGGGHLFLVGDDDQCIYGFRGSDSRLLLRFGEFWPDGAILRLENNYRCAKSILDAAGRLIRENRSRFAKNPKAVRTVPGTVVIRRCEDEEEEAEEALALLRRCRSRAPKTTAVLYRSRYLAAPLMECCIREGIGFGCREPLPQEGRTDLTDDLLAYLSLASGKGSAADAVRILNRPPRGLSRELVPKGSFSFAAWEENARGAPAQLEQIRALKRLAERAAKMTPFAALSFFWQAGGYKDWAQSAAGFRPSAAAAQAKEKERLWAQAAQTGTGAGPQAPARFCDRCRALRREQEEKRQAAEASETRANPDPETGIFFSTFHGAKGLEFDTVLILDANEGYSPCGKNLSAEQLEEERRLFYVALTRAKDRVCIFCTKKHRGRNTPESRFLSEMK